MIETQLTWLNIPILTPHRSHLPIKFAAGAGFVFKKKNLPKMIFLFVFIGCCGGTLFHTFVSPYSPSPQTYNQSAFSTFDLDAVPSAVGGADCVAVRSQQPPSTAAWGVALWASPVDQQSNKIIFAPYSLLVGGLFQSDVSGVYNNVQQLSNTSLGAFSKRAKNILFQIPLIQTQRFRPSTAANSATVC